MLQANNLTKKPPPRFSSLEFGENGQDKPKKVKRAGPVNRGKLYESLIFLNET